MVATLKYILVLVPLRASSFLFLQIFMKVERFNKNANNFYYYNETAIRFQPLIIAFSSHSLYTCSIYTPCPPVIAHN